MSSFVASTCGFTVSEMNAWLTFFDDNEQEGGLADLRGNADADATTLALKATLEDDKDWTVLVEMAPANTIILSPSVISAQRGTAFDITLQAFDPVTNQPNMSYVPSGALTVAFTPVDGDDEINLTSIPATGWTNGQKTVTGVVVTGGTTDSTFYLYIIDPDENYGDKTMEIKDGTVVIPTRFRVRFPYSVGYSFTESAPDCEVPEDYTVNEWSYDSGKTFDFDSGSQVIVDDDLAIRNCSGSPKLRSIVRIFNSSGTWIAYVELRTSSDCGTSFRIRVSWWEGRVSATVPFIIPYYSKENWFYSTFPDTCFSGNSIGADGYAIAEPIL